LQWETKTGFNYSIDFGVLSHRLSGSITYYRYATRNLLYNVDVPGINNFEHFPTNLGRLDNRGINVALKSENIRTNNLQWNTNVTFSRNRNKLKELLGNGKDLPQSGLFIGRSISAIWDYKIDGIWQINDDIPRYSDVGAYKVVDRNGDGVIDADDKSIIGYRTPAYRFSIGNMVHYKNWSLRVFINSVQGGRDHYMAENDIANGWSIINSATHFNLHLPKAIDYWTPESPHAIYQKPNLKIAEGTAGTRYEQRSFVRLQNITLSYSFSAKLLGRSGISNLKIYVSGTNLATWTNWHGWDPETGEAISIDGRPVLRGYTAGINIKF
jgi:hypothetical protein